MKQKAVVLMSNLLLALLVVACENDAAAPGEAGELDALLTGPDQLELSCATETVAQYSGTESTGPIARWEWRISPDTAVISEESSLRHSFSAVGTYVVTLSVFSESGSEAADTLVTNVSPPTDYQRCVAAAFVDGRFALLVSPGGETASATYSLKVMEAVQDSVAVEWSVFDSVSGVERALAGDPGRRAQVEFTPGVYEVRAKTIWQGETAVAARPVRVVEREPFLQAPGWIPVQMWTDATDSQFRSVFYLDGETGVIDGPYLSGTASAIWDCEPRGNRIAYKVFDEQTSSDIWVAHRYGGNQQPIVTTSKIAWMADWGTSGLIAYVDDTRWDGERDEPYLINPDGTDRRPLSGSSTSANYVGFHPALSPAGTGLMALGGLENGREGERTIAIYDITDDPPVGRRLLRTGAVMPFYGDSVTAVNEGANGLAWSPDGEWLAFSAVADTTHYIVRIRPDGKDMEILHQAANVVSGPMFSPDSRYLLFSGIQEGFWRMMIIDLADGSLRDLGPGLSPEMNMHAGGWCAYQ